MSDRVTGRIGRRSAAGVAVLALVAGACAEDAGQADGADVETGAEVGEFAATSEYLAGVADATEGLTYRMSMDMAMGFSGDGQDLETGGTFMTGEVDGERQSMSMDMGEMFAGMPAGTTPDGDLTMDMVVDGDTMYIRAPLYATMAEAMEAEGASPSDLGPIGTLAELGDDWGSVDLAQVSPSQVASAAGGQSADPTAYLDMAAAGTDVRELGTETIDGVETHGLGATVTYGDMIAAQGGDADDFREQLSTSLESQFGGEDAPPAELFDTVFDEMFAVGMPVEVWVDGDDRVRRIVLDMNMAEIMAGVADAIGEEMPDMGMSMSMSMDFTDYGDETIEIEVPAASTDITDEYLALLDGDALGAG